MKTVYKIVVAHDDAVNPDGLVNTAEKVLNRIVQMDKKVLKQSVWLMKLMDIVGGLSHAQLSIDTALDSLNPPQQLPDLVKTYEQLLLGLACYSQVALMQLNDHIEGIKNDTTHTDER